MSNAPGRQKCLQSPYRKRVRTEYVHTTKDANGVSKTFAFANVLQTFEFANILQTIAAYYFNLSIVHFG